MTNPRTVAEWEAVGFRVVEAGEIDKYPRIKFVPPSKRSTQVTARLRAARMRHRIPKDPRLNGGGAKFRQAVHMADLRAIIYCRKIGLA